MGDGVSATDDCLLCGADWHDNRAFVPYEPAPNGAQAETRWAEELLELRVIVCTVCSYPVATVHPDEEVPEDAPDGVPDVDGASEFKFDGVAK